MDGNNTVNHSKDSMILVVEPFYGGSHKQLIDTLVDGIKAIQNENMCLITLPAKKWHWRARTSALYISQMIPQDHNFKVIFTSCVLNLAELIALRLDLSHTKKIVYFHENQLVYPVRKEKERDFQYGYNQIMTCLVADVILFNSKYNQDSFLGSIKKFFRLQPDFRPKDLKEKIMPKCKVLYYPIRFPTLRETNDWNGCSSSNILHIVWPHRWEHDKDPETFFDVLMVLKDAGCSFEVSVLGESFSEIPPVFEEARSHLGSHVVNWGYQETKERYYDILRQSHVVVSTAKHEFFGVAVLEATYCGCLPLCPNDLVYPEFYPPECLYKNKEQLIKLLERFSKDPNLARHTRKEMKIDFSNFSSDFLINVYSKEFLSS